MKKLTKLLIITLPLLVCSCSKKEVEVSSVQVRNGLYYSVGEDTPLTATIVSHHENGQQKLEMEVINGEKVGVENTWFANGKVDNKSVRNADGSLKLTSYWENGNLAFEKKLDAKGDGELSQYAVGGEKVHEIPYKGGLKNGEGKTWNVFNGAVYRVTYKDGRELKKEELNAFGKIKAK